MSYLETWDLQQQRYIAGREDRFAAMVDAIEWAAPAGRGPLVVDLGCGPAAIGQRLLRRLPDARYVGIDVDPVLLHLAREVADEFEWGSIEIVDRHVADPTWLRRDLVGAVDVVCSSTALHWLTDEELDRTLQHSLQALRPGGLLLDADHLGFDAGSSQSSLASWVGRVDEDRAAAEGAPSWDDWWRSVRADPELTGLCARRDAIFPTVAVTDEDEPEPAAHPPFDGFVAAVRRAGFHEVETIWQRFDDRLVMATKPVS